MPPSNGGQSRLYNFYNSLSRWHHITLLTSSHLGGEIETINHNCNFKERRIPKDHYFAEQYGILEKFSSGGDLSGPAIAACSELPTLMHQAYLSEYEQADLLIFDDPFLVGIDIFAGIDSKPRVYNSYNNESLLYQQLHQEEKSAPICSLVSKAEKKLLENADLVLYCNTGDLALFKEAAPAAKYEELYAPNGMSAVNINYKTPKNDGTKWRALFIGSGHPPNIRAAEFIISTLAPAFPEIEFNIVGSCKEEGEFGPNVVSHGVVDSITKNKLLSFANIALNPMESGSGSNVKVLEYFAHGLPVLSTAFGMRGINAKAGTHFIESNLDNFILELKQAYLDPKALASVGDSGRKMAEEHYTWNAILKPVADLIDSMMVNKAKKTDKFILTLNDYDSFHAIGGGGTRTRELYKAASDWCPVIFVCFSSDGKLKAIKISNQITVICIPKTSSHINELANINSQFYVSADDIIAARHCTQNPWLNNVYEILRNSARCIIVEHCYMVGLPIHWGDRFVYSSQNNETELKTRLLSGHPLQSQLVADLQKLESYAVENSSLVIAVSHDDARSFVMGRKTASPILVVPNGAEAPSVGPDVDKFRLELLTEISKRSVVFVGSSHMPNIEAVNFIVKKLAPSLPDIEFHIIGSVCNAIQSYGKNVRIWGILDNEKKAAVMQLCQLALNPMGLGGGSNVKMADYIGNGLFVISTEFGLRGYDPAINNHINVVSLGDFAKSIRNALNKSFLLDDKARSLRISFFKEHLSMKVNAENFVKAIKDMEKTKKRVLYVAYRYLDPAPGGAELNIEKFVRALGESNSFMVDVIAPEVSGIHNNLRFSENYSFDNSLSAPINMPNVRFMRFGVDEFDSRSVFLHLQNSWVAQPLFEKACSSLIKDSYAETGLTWGWGQPEGVSNQAARWAFSACEMFLAEDSIVEIHAYSEEEVVITILLNGYICNGPKSYKGYFDLSLEVLAGSAEINISSKQPIFDPRPLGVWISKLVINGVENDLSKPTLLQKTIQSMPPRRVFEILDAASQESRTPLGASLTDGRGPWSRGLENFITQHTHEYDLVVTHNNIFRPAIAAINAAKKFNVPSILIPHAHLDDDFYHFPDVLQSARDATLVLAAPKAACDFLRERGCNAEYLPAGCDINEGFTLDDKEAFENIYNSKKPFILVLGRKAGAKGYQHVVKAIEDLNKENIGLNAVLIGPDDDGVEINSKYSAYLGKQPRNVVRGALMSCMALCNMSASESFGIVLLEAWLAGKPVIANKNCAAFHDLAMDGENATLVDSHELLFALKNLMSDYKYSKRLALNGKDIPKKYSWDNISKSFLGLCLAHARSNGG